MSKQNKVGFVVLGIRHFINGEHHWIAPEREDAAAFAEDGEVRENEYGKPVFTSLKDAENYAMSIVHDEYTLAQWEERRPTMYVVEECVFVDIVEKDNYTYPECAEKWSDAKVADFERECDCEDIENQALWDSITDTERVSEYMIQVAHALSAVDGLVAWIDEGSKVCVEAKDMTADEIRDFVYGMEDKEPFCRGSIEFNRAEGKTAYFDVV